MCRKGQTKYSRRVSCSYAASFALWLSIAGGCAGKIVEGRETPPSGALNDTFGVRMLNPSLPGGRSWLLPERAELPSAEWNVERVPVTRVAAGVFHTQGNAGEVRLTVGSPATRAWWRNVEVTGYFRYTAAADSNEQ